MSTLPQPLSDETRNACGCRAEDVAERCSGVEGCECPACSQLDYCAVCGVFIGAGSLKRAEFDPELCDDCEEAQEEAYADDDEADAL